MHFETGQYYHVYNRSNAGEIVFKEPENYLYFLRKYRQYLTAHFATIAYCLMPTHFHFLVQIKTEAPAAQNALGVLLSSYAQAINKRYQRHGSLFQDHSKAKWVNNERYLLKLMTYIHQNPIRAGLATRLDNWPYSSYPDLAGYRKGDLPERSLVSAYFHSDADFRSFSQQTLSTIEAKYWV